MLELGVVHAGQHGDGEQRGVAGLLGHRAQSGRSRRRMHREEAHPHARRRCCGFRHGCRDVVQLEVQEALGSRVVDGTHGVGSGRSEQLEPHLEHADLGAQLLDEPTRGD